jgi:heptosyltransferase-2
MDKVGLFKKIDKIVGTPLCFLLGVIDRLLFRKNNSSPNPRKILVIKFIAIGDMVVALPTLRALKKSFPKSHLAVLVTPRVKEVVEECPYLDEIIYYDILGKDKGIKGLFNILGQLREKKFDLVIELDLYYRITSLISYFSEIKNRVGFDLRGQGRKHLYTLKVPYLIDKHEVESFLEIAKKIGADISDKELVEIGVSDKDKEYVAKFLTEAGVGEKDFLVGLHPGTSKSPADSRRWSGEKFGKLADWIVKQYGAKVIFTGLSSDVELINESVKFMTTKPILAAGKTNLKQFAEIARRCKIFVVADTGALHVAAAMKTRVVGIYGPSTPEKWGPYGKEHTTIYKALECSPCLKVYLGQIFKCKNPVCMDKISVKEVKEAVEKLLPIPPA